MKKVYSGTTLENYKKCAFTDNEGNIFFDKTREPKHMHSRLYFDEQPSTAIVFGIACARSLIPKHIPLIMQGIIPEDLGYSSLDPKVPFCVKKVYLPKPNTDWENLNTYSDWDLKKHFDKSDPKNIMS